MNPRYYIDKLTYEVGEVVVYEEKQRKITHIHKDGLVNLTDGWFYILGAHPNMLYKVENQ
jgi:hypothetical protein